MDLDTESLAALITQKHTVLVQLRDLAKAQRALIESGDVTSLLKVLSGKQQLIAVLQTVERQLEPYHGQDPNSRRWSTPAARTACAEQADRCRALLDEIVALEKTCEGELRTRRDEAAQQLQGTHSALTARAAYTSPAGKTPNPSNLLDLSSDK